MTDDEVIHDQLIVAINASVTEVWSPFYGPPGIPFDVDKSLATRALRRWRSAHRRKLGRRDEVHDLARGLIEWADEQSPDMPLSDGEKDEYRWMAELLAGVLDPNRQKGSGPPTP